MIELETVDLAPGLNICRILNGMWQVSGTHGQIEPSAVIPSMSDYHNKGLTTWDLADIYGPAESYIGEFREQLGPNHNKSFQALPKFVPNPGPMTRNIVEHHIDQSLKKMNTDTLDLVQFHWWDYDDLNYLDAMIHLFELKEKGKIKQIGLTNFDTRRIEIMFENNLHPISNQVQYSILDQRPEIKMTPFCLKNNMSLLCYGTLLGGYLSEKYLGVSEPTRMDMDTASLQKYKNMIDEWGGWNLFQELLVVLDEIAKKHNSSIANVSVRFILNKPAVAGVIIGTRLSISEHIAENSHVFELFLDDSDYSKIDSITTKANDLFKIIGDCGDEYR